MRYPKIALILLVLLVKVSFAQKDDKASFQSKFEEANILMEDKYYNLALPIWLKLLETDRNNANLNYKIGFCYFHAHNHREKAEPYLESAVIDATKNYDPFMHSFKQAPVESYYYLGHIYHLDYQLDKAVENFLAFQKHASKKHFLYDDTDHQIEMISNAKELMKDAININIINLGDGLNTEDPEYSPIISLDESTIYYTTRRLRKDSSNLYYKETKDGMYFEDIYVSHKDYKGKWSEPTPININVLDDHSATINLSADGQTMFIYKDDEGNGNIYKSHLDDNLWTQPELLSSDINTDAQESHATLSADGRTLYFVSDRDGGFGGKDIYRCVKLPNGKWSLAQNAGPVINSKYDEDAPFFHPDGKAMYFSSKGHKSMGGYDIFITEVTDDGIWSKPRNVGYPINSTDNDIFYIVTPDGKRAYYSSNHEGGKGEQDIYLMELTDAIEKSLTLLKGFIVVPEGKLLPSSLKLLVTDNETGELVAEGRPMRRNGSFIFIIPPGKNYNVSYEANDKEFYNENIYVPYGSEYNEINKEILLDPVKLGAGEIVVKRILGNKRWQFKYKELGQSIPAGLKVNFLDDQGNILFTEFIDEKGIFPFHILPPDRNVYLSLANTDINCQDIEFILVDFKGNVMDVLRLSKEDGCTFPADIDIKEIPVMPAADDAHLVDVPPDETNNNNAKGSLANPVSMQEFFGYNKTDVQKKKQDLNKVIAAIVSGVKDNKAVKIAVEASASKVPTRTFGSNKKLAKRRAKKAKDSVLALLKKSGIKASQVTFVRPKTLVQGPGYKGDHEENQSEYEKYQYVKIKAY